MRLLVVLLLSSLCYGQNLELLKTYEGDSLYLDIANYRAGKIWFEAAAIDSLGDQVRFKEYGFVAPQDTVLTIAVIPKSLVPDTTGFNIKTYVDMSFKTADPRATHSKDYPYHIPYSKKRKYEVIQSFNGKFSHRLPTSKYAIDFDMPIGTPILAAREGIISGTEDQFTEHGGRDFMGKANYIVITHDDGTMAQYLHLDHKGVKVSEGDRVERGQLIGYSGHTGFSTRPHLHFVIKNGKSISLLFYFEGYKKLKSGKKYRGQGQ